MNFDQLFEPRLEAGLPVMPSESHIVPVVVGNPRHCKAISDELLLRFGIYVQPINYPTVPRDTERLRLTPTPLHSDEQIDRLWSAIEALPDPDQPSDTKRPSKQEAVIAMLQRPRARPSTKSPA